MRKTRKGELVCRCRAYRFPHRMFGGECRLISHVHAVFDPFNRDCSGCISLEVTDAETTCQVCEGREQAFHCPLLREYIAYEGIILYGQSKRMKDAAERKRK